MKYDDNVIIDVQNDYFPGGSLPLWNVNAVLQSILWGVEQAKRMNMPIILIQHVAEGPSDIFRMDSYGAAIHKELLAAVPNPIIVTKNSTDSFRNTCLRETLDRLGINELVLCGMQTQNCVGLTGISMSAKPYKVTLLSDRMTAETRHVHLFALNGFGALLPVMTSQQFFEGAD